MTQFLQFLGGISLFLYGMSAMGDSLRVLSGSRMKTLLARTCRTPLRGVIFGALVTAAIQSSSATTVMVVGFVNAGLMTLQHAVGVIMGGKSRHHDHGVAAVAFGRFGQHAPTRAAKARGTLADPYRHWRCAHFIWQARETAPAWLWACGLWYFVWRYGGNEHGGGTSG